MPLKTATDEATNWLPVSTTERVVGNCEYTMVEGDIELRTGVGRALPHRGFKALHPNRHTKRISKGAKRRDGDILFNLNRDLSHCDCSTGGPSRARAKCINAVVMLKKGPRNSGTRISRSIGYFCPLLTADGKLDCAPK